MPSLFLPSQLVALLVLALLLSNGSSAGAVAPHRTDDVFVRVVEKKRKEIEAELERLGTHDWAGWYHIAGPHESISIWISPTAAVHTFYGCMGLYDQNYGTVNYQDGLVRIDWKLETSDELHFPREYLIVKWQERRYLVPTAELFEFSNDYREYGNDAPERLQWTNYLRKDGEKLPVLGDPQLPRGYEKYMTLKHVQGRITGLGAIKEFTRHEFEGKLHIYYRQPVTINLGRQHGVVERMRLNTASARDVTVMKVEADHCEAIAEFETVAGANRIPLELNDVVTSKR
jgi:hypothetical protein